MNHSYLRTSERDNTSFPYADGLNRELGLGFPMAKISERTTNSHTFSFYTSGDKGKRTN